MGIFTGLKKRRGLAASVGVVTAAAVAVTTLAFVYEGNPTAEVELNDGGVWLTRNATLQVGRFNDPSQVLDGAFTAAKENYDVLQRGDDVFVVDQNSVTRVDPARVLLSDSGTIPSGGKVVLGGPNVAIMDRQGGSVWIVPADAAGTFQAPKAEPAFDAGKNADITVGADGTVYVLSPDVESVVALRLTPEGEPEEAGRTDVGEVGVGSSITVVGDRPAVLDPEAGTLITPGGRRTDVPNALGAVLQQPSESSDHVSIATSTTLVQVPFGDGEPTLIEAKASGAPAEPVQLLGCDYAAWSGSARFVRECPGADADLAVDVDGATATSVLVFRRNRDVILLNDVTDGAAWIAKDSLQRVDNWSDVTPPQGEDTEDNEQTTIETVETTLPERSEQNTPPVAVDDAFGVRAGRTTVLAIIDNDTDADGDVLTATLPDGPPQLGDVEPIFNGTALQITVPKGATGTDTFVYEVDDGRGGTDRATVTLTVHPDGDNAPPKQKRVPGVIIESGGAITYNVLPDWSDPDGDDIFLAAVYAADGDEVTFSPDGRVTYRALAPALGPKDIEVVMSDGDLTTSGTLRLDVRPPASTMPITNADHVVVRAGQTATVAPLANDISAGRDPLRLTRVAEVAGLTIEPDFQAKTFTVSGQTVGTSYVDYIASSGANSVPGIVRVDVIADDASDLPPIAVRDVAMLPQGGEVLVGVLDNDSDPSGGILVVQSVDVPADAGISAAVLGHQTLRVTDNGTLSQPVRFTYTISNGSKSATGEVIVIPTPPTDARLPPVANDDEAVVRVGDVVTIPVMQNDYHPNGDVIHVSPDLVAPFVTPEQGDVFVSQNTVRFRASQTPGTVYVTYEVVDSVGQRDAGYVTIQVLPLEADANAAPRPVDLTARVLAGTTSNIVVQLDGIDPDGDSVELVGIGTGPAKGRITEVAANYIAYEAYASSAGVDTFTYIVRDRLGKEATGSVRVGIAPPEAVNQAPYAVKDSVVMRPGRTVAVPVLDNDSDPDGDVIGLTDWLDVPDIEGLSAEVEGGRVIVTAPDRELSASIQYKIRDARGAEAIGVLVVTVDEDVPLLAPIAVDDRVRAADIDDETLTATVEVLANDRDPDGTVDQLDLVLEPGTTARVLPDRSVEVTVSDAPQAIKYTITDQDGLTASAFIQVPAVHELTPRLYSVEPVVVVSGETVQIPLAEHIKASGGAAVRITQTDRVRAGNANGAELVQDEATLVYTSKEGYFGPDAISVEVTDGTGPDDPEGRKATLSIPITVLPPANQPPSFTAGTVTVAPGEAATRLDLRGLTTDPDPGDLDRVTYQIVGGTPTGVTASIDGQSLVAEAATNTPKGTTGTLTLRITDGQTDPIEGTVTITVGPSTRPLAVAVDDVITRADQGKALVVDVLKNDSNPFPGQPLTVMTAVLESGQATVERSDSSVTVTPDKDFVGTVSVRYRIQDATGDAEREVEGSVVVTVQGRPATPGTPSVSSVQDRTVVLSWSPPKDNGSEITGYTVTSVAGTYTKQCASTTCTLDGLTNNVEYNFTVTATNAVGTSDPSAPSPTARPDARPDTPAAPTLAFGDRLLQVAWATPSTPGSPVERFTLEISPAPPNGVVQKTVPVQGASNAFTWEGLENGVPYQIRVQAINRAPEPSSWSPWSAAMIPAAPPAAPGGVAVSAATPVGEQGQVTVSWSAPANNGDPVNEYQVQVMLGGSVVSTVSAGTNLSQNVTLNVATSDYSFVVLAKNKAGWGPTSEPVDRRVATPPGPPTAVALAPADGAVVVTFGAAAGNGANPGEITYEANIGGGWIPVSSGSSLPANNGSSYTAQVRATSTVGGTGPAASSDAVIPFGPPRQPGANGTVSGTNINWSWSAPASNGRDIVKMEVMFSNSGNWQTVALTGQTTGGYGHSQSITMQVRATDSAGQVSTNAVSRTTVAPPQPRAWTSKGASVRNNDCSNSSCAYMVVNVENFPAGNYTLKCNATGPFGGNWGWSGTISVPANGSARAECFFGDPGERAWVSIVGWGDAESLTWY